MAMKKDKKHYNKMKRYWKLLLKSRDELDCSKWKRFTCFPGLMTEVDVVNYIVNSNIELKETYEVYQQLLYSFKNNDINLLKKVISSTYYNISSYMETSIKTLNEFLPHIENTFTNKYHNGFIEGLKEIIILLKS